MLLVLLTCSSGFQKGRRKVAIEEGKHSKHKAHMEIHLTRLFEVIVDMS